MSYLRPSEIRAGLFGLVIMLATLALVYVTDASGDVTVLVIFIATIAAGLLVARTSTN